MAISLAGFLDVGQRTFAIKEVLSSKHKGRVANGNTVTVSQHSLFADFATID
jgi:hypothetical protein